MKQPPTQFRLCEDCGATSEATTPRCWLCGRSLRGKDETVVATWIGAKSEKDLEPLFAVLTFAAGMLSLLLIFGTAPSQPMISAYVAICVAPALLATIVRTVGRRALGKPFTWQSTLVTFVLSVTVVLAIFGLLFIALVVYLYVICVRNFEMHGP